MLKVLIAAAMISAAAPAQTCKEATPGLAAKAKVSCADAQKTALARVPKAKVKSAELEEENGKLVYSFDLKQQGKPGIEEVDFELFNLRPLFQDYLRRGATWLSAPRCRRC